MNEQLISIQSVPRSGSSWLGQIFRSSPRVAFRFQPLFSYAFKGRLNEQSTREEILRFYQDIKNTKDDFVLQRIGSIHVDYPHWDESAEATHIVMKEVRYNNVVRNMIERVPELRVVGLVRHPCAVIDSWINAPREFKPEWSVQEQWRSGGLKNQGRPEECFGFDKWKEVAELFLELKALYPDRVSIVRYCDLNNDTESIVQELFSFCGLEYGRETAAFIHLSMSKEGSDANSIYRLARRDDVWKKRLPQAIGAEIIEELKGTRLEQFLC